MAAQQCDRDIPITDQQTEYNTVYAQPDGHYRVDTSLTAIRTKVSGSWAPIDTHIVQDAAGLRPASPAVGMVFGAKAGDPLVRMTRDGHELDMSSPFALTTPVIDGSKITYPGVAPGVDLIVTVDSDGTGFHEVLAVKDAQAAANPRLSHLSFPLRVDHGLSLKSADGGFEADDDAGTKMFSSPLPQMWDSTGQPQVTSNGAGGSSAGSRSEGDGTPEAIPDAASVTSPSPRADMKAMAVAISNDTVTITPNQNLLHNSDTTWPVYIDPGVTASLNDWGLIRSGLPNTVVGYKYTGDEGIGLCDPAAAAGCSIHGDVFRLLYGFEGLATIGHVNPEDVMSATFSAFGTWSYSCTATSVGAFWTPALRSNTTWNSISGGWNNQLDQKVVSHGHPNCPNEPARWIEFNVKKGLQGTAAGNYSGITIGLKAATETTMAGGWKRYRNDARLSVVYDRPPNPPTNMGTSNPSTTCVSGSGRPVIRSATPTLHATLTDPDKDPVAMAVDVYRMVSARPDVFSSTWTAAQASGSVHSITVPSGRLTEGTYEWYAVGKANNRLGPNAKCEFQVDLTPPVKPVVAPVTGQPAVYTEGATSGGIGLAGEFSLGNGGSSDVVSYKYSFGSNVLDKSVTAATHLISFTPTTDGPQTLYVASVDKAGWVSPVRTYSFGVTFAGRTSQWKLDEGTGSVAKNSITGGADLTLANPAWAGGALGGDTNHALSITGDGQGGSTSGPQVATGSSYTVMAYLNPDAADGADHIAISQDGSATSGFTLGITTSQACPKGCWSFAAPTSDAPDAAQVQAVSSRPVDPGGWTHVTGVYDAGSGTISVYVCSVAQPTDVPAPTTSPFTTPWQSLGSFRIGGDSTSSTWRGAIDDVRTYKGVVAPDTIFSICHGEK